MITIQTTTEMIESKDRLILAGKVVRKIGMGSIQNVNFKNAGDIFKSLFGLIVEGRSDFKSMTEKRENLFFTEALDYLFVYAKETIRLYFGKITEDNEGIIQHSNPIKNVWCARILLTLSCSDNIGQNRKKIFGLANESGEYSYLA